MSAGERKFRVTLWSLGANGWRGDQKAVVFDAKSIGVEEFANDTGSAFWTLSNDHPQIAEFVPLQRHYEISRWSDDRSRWEFVGAGMLNDYTATEFETTFSGLDYKAILNQMYTPLSGMTTGDANQLSSTAGTGFASLNTVLELPIATATTALRYLNTDAIEITGPIIETYANDIRQITYDEYVARGGDPYDPPGGLHENVMFRGSPDEYATWWITPELRLSWSAIWNGGTASTGFDPAQTQWRIYAFPPTSEDQGSPPLASTGIVGEFQYAFQTSTLMPNGTNMGSYEFRVFPEELQAAINKLPDAAGILSFQEIDATASIEPDGNTYSYFLGQSAPLRSGISYGFQIYGAVRRTATGANIWYRSASGTVMTSTDTSSPQYDLPARFTMGQGNENASVKISRVFENAVRETDPDYSRLRYATLSISGTTATTHVTYSVGEPVLDHIAKVCDLEMGAKTTGDKVVFGIDKPTNGATYSGNFKLNLSVASSPSTALALKYPDNIVQFSFTPGFSRVRNDVTVIPATAYLSGSTAQNVNGTMLIGGAAVDQSSITAYGKIPLITAASGLVDEDAANREASRLINTYKAANAKQVSIRVVLDGVDLWNGWDVGDSVSVTIKRGLTDVNEPFVISGVRWFGESNGQERVELELVQGTAFSAARGV